MVVYATTNKNINNNNNSKTNALGLNVLKRKNCMFRKLVSSSGNDKLDKTSDNKMT